MLLEHPFAPADALGRRQRTRRHEAGVRDHACLGLGRQRGKVGGRLGRGGRVGPHSGDERGDALGDDPVDHSGILSSMLSVSGERAANTGELGSAVSGAPSGWSHHGKLT